MRFDIRQLDPAFYDNPYPTYRQLRDEQPVYHCPDGSWFLSRHADVIAVYRDAAVFSSDKTKEFFDKFGACPLYEHHTTSLVFNDPPLHTIVRKRIAASLKPNAVAATQAAIESLVESLLDRIESINRFDAVADFAARIPVEVIGNLLGIPHSERAPLRDWSLAILGALEASISATVYDRGNDAVTEFDRYLRQLIASRKAAIAAGRATDDLLTRLIQGRAGDESLDDTELIHNAIFILNAGHETTTNLIANGISTLVGNPIARQQFVSHPEVQASAIEELLRFESPNQLGNRITTQSVKIGDTQLPMGARIWLGIGAANRDPEVFRHPDALELDRKPNAHLAFAAGIHSCIGLNLARLEARIALGRLFQRFPNLASNGDSVRAERARFRGFDSLPMVANV